MNEKLFLMDLYMPIFNNGQHLIEFTVLCTVSMCTCYYGLWTTLKKNHIFAYCVAMFFFLHFFMFDTIHGGGLYWTCCIYTVGDPVKLVNDGICMSLGCHVLSISNKCSRYSSSLSSSMHRVYGIHVVSIIMPSAYDWPKVPFYVRRLCVDLCVHLYSGCLCVYVSECDKNDQGSRSGSLP